MVKVLSWYDNEWGYSCRVRDLIKFLASKGAIAFVVPPPGGTVQYRVNYSLVGTQNLIAKSKSRSVNSKLTLQNLHSYKCWSGRRDRTRNPRRRKPMLYH